MAYQESSKRVELFDPLTRFLIASKSPLAAPAQTTSKGKGKSQKVDIPPEALLGFCSFRFDTEETMTSRDAEVVYCYELQLAPSARGLGLGQVLMAELEDIGRRRRMDKVMLTCLSNNHFALKFYSKLGYDADEIDPTRMLEEEDGDGLPEGEDEDEEEEAGDGSSDGQVDYRILSKSLEGS